MRGLFSKKKRNWTIAGAVCLAFGAGGFAAYAATSFAGSDTLTGVIKDSITGAGLSADLTYLNLGSGKGESGMTSLTQSIGPMSRNFRLGIIGCPSGSTAAPCPAAPTHPTWAPSFNKVLCLDAGVFVTFKLGALNIADINSANSTFAGSVNNGWRARVGKTPDPLITEKFICGADTLTADAKCNPFENTNIWRVALAGKDGTGTRAACAHPDRLAALTKLGVMEGIGAPVEHIFRRDDNSGTTDTFKEKLGIARFCNGTGGGTAATNQDDDPIRRDCSGHGICAADGTQGVVVPLSEPQDLAGNPDITVAIGKFVSEGAGQWMGYAGRESIKTANVGAPKLEGVSPIVDANVQGAAQPYPLSRRLFLQNMIDVGDTCPTCPGVVKEQALFDWATDQTHMVPLCKKHGFVPCPNTALNLCNNEPFGPTVAFPAAFSRPGSACAAGGFCSDPAGGTAAVACPGSLVCPKLPAGAGCASNAECTSGNCADPDFDFVFTCQ